MPNRLANNTKGARSIRYLTEIDCRNVATSGGLSNILLATIVALACLSGCVETAECDATVPCETGDRCYDYECHPICEVDTDCGRGARCAPCQQDDSEGTIDHCFEATDHVCILEE